MARQAMQCTASAHLNCWRAGGLHGPSTCLRQHHTHLVLWKLDASGVSRTLHWPYRAEGHAPQAPAARAGTLVGSQAVTALTRVHVQVAEAAGAQQPLRELVLGLSTSMLGSTEVQGTSDRLNEVARAARPASTRQMAHVRSGARCGMDSLQATSGCEDQRATLSQASRQQRTPGPR